MSLESPMGGWGGSRVDESVLVQVEAVPAAQAPLEEHRSQEREEAGAEGRGPVDQVEGDQLGAAFAVLAAAAGLAGDDEVGVAVSAHASTVDCQLGGRNT